MKLRLVFLIIVNTALLFASCSPERKLASRFVKNVPKPSVLVLLPEAVFKENLKWTVEKDSVTDTIQSALVIDNLQDKTVLDAFTLTFTNELSKYGLTAYTDKSMEDFMMLDSSAWMINIAQIELQEYTTQYTDNQSFFGNDFSSDFALNGINSAFWFEFNPVNGNENQLPEIMFAANDLYDKFEGRFIMDVTTGELTYQLDLDTITNQDFMNQINFTARLLAGYTFDYLMNRYVGENYPDADQYFRYDPFRKRLYETLDDRFVPLN
jgi:hypothetical protein